MLAAALAGCVAFCFAAIFDWIWQIPALAIAALLLAVALVGWRPGPAGEAPVGFGLPRGSE